MIFIQFSFVTRGRDRWYVLKKWKMKKGNLLECLFQKRVKHQKWYWGNSIPLPFLTYISSYIPTGAILSLVPLPSDFICTFVTPCFSPYPNKEPFTQISSFSFYIQTGTIYMNYFPFRINLLYYLYFLLNQVVHTLQA